MMMSPIGASPVVPFSPPTQSVSFSGSTNFGVVQGSVTGGGTLEMGPAGISASVPFAPGFNPAASGLVVDNLGLASPFAQTREVTQFIPRGSFGLVNPFSPNLSTPFNALFNPMILPTFGPIQNPIIPNTPFTQPV